MSISVCICCFLPLTHPQLWCTWCGIHGPAPRHGHSHPDALPAWPGEPLPPPFGSFKAATFPFSIPPAQSWSLLTHQGRLLTLLDDSSLHLWEIIHQNGCAHLEEALSFQLPSRLGFDGARYWGTWPLSGCSTLGASLAKAWWKDGKLLWGLGFRVVGYVKLSLGPRR